MIVIHHNPDCGTSRNILALIEASGEAPVVVDYLKQGWTRPQLLALFAAAGLTPRTALRETKSPAKELARSQRPVSVIAQEWEKCLTCRDFDHCYKLSLGKLSLATAISEK